MSIRVAINHKTSYHYDHPVQLGPHVLRLRPASHSRTAVSAYSLTIKPDKHFINWQQDPFGNYLARLVFPEKTTEFSIEVDLIADMTVINPFDFFLEEYAEHYPFSYPEQLAKELAPYLEIREQGPLLKGFLAGLKRDKQGIVDFLVSINQAVNQVVNYAIRMEPGVQSCEETLEKKLGSCRDSGWLLVQVLRHMGLAARFVSGYLVQLVADVKSLDGPSGTDHDFTDLHAWAEVYIPGAGWIGMDPTSGLFAGEGHIPLACTADYVSAAPVSGGFIGKAETTFDFSNRVSRIHEDPRVTKPYTDKQWTDIERLGEKVDAELKAGDVRLTMGGEPTFVSIDNMDAPEWNTDADGEEKRKLAGKLVRRLRDSFAPGGLLYFGQGKWYPGEPLPRWQLACFWRKDGKPIWKNPALLADETRDYGFDLKHADAFIRDLVKRLGVAGEFILPGFEDPLYYLLQEGLVPKNLDPLQVDLKDDLERQRLAKLLSADLGAPVGYVLPLHWSYQAGSWNSSAWEFRRGAMFLVPGDSAMGLRLPLNCLPWVPFEKRDHPHERSLYEPVEPLGDIDSEVSRRYSQMAKQGLHPTEMDAADDERPHDPEWVPHTALSVQAREGRLFVFVPPTTELEHYLDIIASVEATAAALKMPVVIEGYQPPHDLRLTRLPVTPDPGVIEVNIHPAASWKELVHNTTTLYELARLTRLGTEKFMLDGRHTGTGGGNHVTLGGITPADSPILRRPDLLRSLVTYWQHHPALSYLFSGLFIGPTSQAPRVDEARNDSLYELEIAFQQMPEGEVAAPWLVDRLFRNLLVDMTGNTHRSEFCIDKLYAPGTDAGRLGLLELRAFEMPPHARMSLMQMLLLRTLVAWFWREPYKKPLVRWGTQLHDRFMLPHFIASDIYDVARDLQAAGYEFKTEWFAPFLEFRFPRIGSLRVNDLQLDLYQAIEPWHVLGEEITSSGTARYVDSSVERLQVSLTGAMGERYALTCNGRRVPLKATGKQGELVAGIRYRAWNPPSALHPSIGVQAPLVFDLVDTWNGRSIGGCTYHVSHPGGRNYDTLPVNAYEAEGRRVSRFWQHGHTPTETVLELPSEEFNKDYPFTLDLRWNAS
ncbi:transglutaminase family protein [Methylomonas sp. LW13]|uniref:transglutaminase family protein n=1 Tax=unclassified Methylomonas TaxID=2608980 RepID=UPI00051C1877|nr:MULTISPECIES: transglutaminase family protein [unclassified Methylomonas]PKD38475.1 IMP dehydrogenase [Methylomonas sp. Kb3]QBC28744.1 transglutaminase family protein [Methylomonas sp. LW13]